MQGLNQNSGSRMNGMRIAPQESSSASRTALPDSSASGILAESCLAGFSFLQTIPVIIGMWMIRGRGIFIKNEHAVSGHDVCRRK